MDYREAYQDWLTRFSRDQAMITELKKIAGDEKEIEDRFYTDLSFGTAGMRGVIGAGRNRMNKYNVRRATKGLAEYILANAPEGKERGVVIAYDSRKFSAEFARDTALVLCACGVKAMLFDALRPVPVLSFAVRHLKAIAGVVITASHNPAKYNGYKVYWEDGAQISPEIAERMTQIILSTPYEECAPMQDKAARDAGLLRLIGNKDVDDAYVAAVKACALRPDLLQKEASKLRIVYTPLHGSGNIPVRRVLKECGFTHVTVVREQEQPDANFPTVSAPNPEDPNAFKLAIPLAKQTGASVIFGTDPDCDRLGVAVKDESGVFHTLTGNQIGCLLLYHILTAREEAKTLPDNGAVVKSVVSTELARPICEDFGVTLYDTLTGFKYIGEKMEEFARTGEKTFLFGFEESYGYLSGTHCRDKDGVNASLLLAEAACVCSTEGVTLWERLQSIRRHYGRWDERVISKTLPGSDGLEKMRGIMARLREKPPEAIGEFKVTAARDFLSGKRVSDNEIETLDFPKADVLYYELEGGHWLCIRPSGTEPKIKLYVNCKGATDDEAKALSDSLEKAAGTLTDE